MFKLQQQSSNIVKRTQLTNDQMPEFHCHCKCSKCLPPAPSSNTSFQSSCVCWRAVLMEDEPDGQPAIALKQR